MPNQQGQAWYAIRCPYCPEERPAQLVPKNILEEIVGRRRESGRKDPRLLTLVCLPCKRVFQYRYAREATVGIFFEPFEATVQRCPTFGFWSRGCDTPGCGVRVDLYGFPDGETTKQDWFAEISKCDIAGLVCEQGHQQTDPPSANPTGQHLDSA